MLFVCVTETTSTCLESDVQSALSTVVSASSDLSTADQSTSVPPYLSWSSSYRYADNALTYDQPGYETSSTTPTVAKQHVDYMPCNMQQRLVCGGAMIQYHSTGGAVFNDVIQQRALSDLSGMSFGQCLQLQRYDSIAGCYIEFTR